MNTSMSRAPHRYTRYATMTLLCAPMLAGCGREPVPDATPAEAPAAAPAVESSLAVKRGVMMLAPNAWTFRLCGEAGDLQLADPAGTGIDDVYARLTQGTTDGLYVEVRGDRAVAETGPQSASGVGGVFVLEELLYAAIPGEGGGCATAAPNWIVRASGNEPFWAVEVGPAGLTYTQPGAPSSVSFQITEPDYAEGTVIYRSSSADHMLELTLSAIPCSDSMSGAYFAYTASARFDGRELQGCARLLE